MIFCDQGVMATKTRERKNPLHLFSPLYFSFLSHFPQKITPCPQTSVLDRFTQMSASVHVKGHHCKGIICANLGCLSVSWRHRYRNPERATPILGLCHSVFTDLFFFQIRFRTFFPWAFGKEKVNLKKFQNTISRCVGFPDWFMGRRRQQKIF